MRKCIAGSELVARLGPHPSARWGLDLATDGGLARWFVAACLLAPRADEAATAAALGALGMRGLADTDALAHAAPGPVAAALIAAGYRKPEITAARLVRASTQLAERHRGSLASLASGAGDLAELASALMALAPGIGAATASEFLRPLRERFVAARELPLSPAAHAAALHVGLLREGQDEDGEPGALRAALAREAPPPALADVEAALARLGRAACRRGAVARCPLAADCPARP